MIQNNHETFGQLIKFETKEAHEKAVEVSSKCVMIHPDKWDEIVNLIEQLEDAS